MIRRLYIDPGVHHHACATFDDFTLVRVDFVAPDAFMAFPSPEALFELVIEKPQLYPGSDEKDPNDCVDVFGAARLAEGFLRSRGGPIARYVFPNDWKGQMKKPPHHLRVWDVLTPAERAVFARDSGHDVDGVNDKIQRACQLLAAYGKVKEYSWQAHNLLDAVGLGLWHLKRTGRAGHRFSRP